MIVHLNCFEFHSKYTSEYFSKLSSKHRVHSWNGWRSKYLTEKSSKQFNIARHFIVEKQSRQDGNDPGWNPTQHKGKDDIKKEL